MSIFKELTPFGREVIQEMTLDDVIDEIKLQECRWSCIAIANRDICEAWGMTDEQRVEQLNLVAEILTMAGGRL